MKKVLIAIDYNPSSEQVARAGQDLARLMDAEICLIHVTAQVAHYGMTYPTPILGYEGYDVGAVDPTLTDEIRQVSQDYLNTAAKHIDSPNGVTTYLAEGNAGRAILDYAEKWRADLIVMGTHSHSVLEKLLVGTVASTVLEKTTIPVYMVPVKRSEKD